MSQESENKGSWLSNPRTAARVLWITVGVVGWLVLMLFAFERSLGADSHGGGAIVLPLVVAFMVIAFGFTFVIPESRPVARSIGSLVFLLIALFYSGVFTWSFLSL